MMIISKILVKLKSLTYHKTLYISIILLLAITIFTLGIPKYSLAINKCTDFDSNSNTISINCDRVFNEKSFSFIKSNVLKKESNDEWTLNASLKISPKASLIIDKKDVSWLKIINNPKGQPNFISVYGGLKINGVKITSWDLPTHNYINQNTNGSILRPYITIERSASPVKITNSEIAYLGYNEYPANGLVFANGGDGSKIENNIIHNNWDGLYSNSLGHSLIDNNTVSNNYRYGIDIHSGSHDINATSNKVYNNGKVGMNCSVKCNKVIFQNNIVKYNGVAGLMFSLDTTNSAMLFNNIYNEKTAISLFSVSNNIVKNNTLISNNVNILVDEKSLNNIVSSNVIR